MASRAPAVVDGALVGLRAWLSGLESAKVDPRELQASVDAFMAALDTRQERDGAAVGALTKRMDAGGFTLVTRKKGGAAAASAALPGLPPPEESDNAKSKRKRGSLQKADFYAWQGRDAKLDRLAELRRRFEEDKERIRRMKQARRGAEFA